MLQLRAAPSARTAPSPACLDRCAPLAGPALAWCEEQRPRLRKAKSKLEFKLRVQVRPGGLLVWQRHLGGRGQPAWSTCEHSTAGIVPALPEVVLRMIANCPRSFLLTVPPCLLLPTHPQEFVELVRAGQQLEAIAYARRHLAPWASQVRGGPQRASRV